MTGRADMGETVTAGEKRSLQQESVGRSIYLRCSMPFCGVLSARCAYYTDRSKDVLESAV